MTDLKIPPTFAARLARDVYALTSQPNLELAFRQLNADYGGNFMFTRDNLLAGKTGGPALIKCRTGFGFALIGQGSLKGHVFILFRGTKYLADWLTNLNISVSKSTFGQPAHDGFNLAFKSMKSKLQEFMKHNQGATVHCIGHSLGGALATLCAEWIASAYRIKPYLYTFGSPRVGLVGFVDMCTKNIGCERIFRAYHRTDVVPCIPIWPFIHTPNSGKDYFLPSPGLIPAAAYHSMDKYVESVAGKPWGVLGALKPEQKSDTGIKEWLKQSGPINMTITSLEWLNQAIVYVINKCIAGAAQLISIAATTTLSIMDSLAIILEKGVNMAEAVSTWVLYLIRKILCLLGYSPAVDAADITRHFVRSVLLDLQQKVNRFAQTALSQTLVQGRAL